MKISIGILTYGRLDEFKETVKCLSSIKSDIDLVILNNNESEMGILELLNSELGSNIQVTYIHHAFNYGVSSGRRKLVEASNADVMILLDDDVYLTEPDSIIEKVKNEFESNTNLGGLAFNIRQFSDSKSNRYEIPHKNKRFDVSLDQETYLMIGAGHAINLNKARLVDSYPDDFGLYGFEEVYLSLKLINAGYIIKYNSGCVVYHKKSPDGRFSNKRVNYLAYRNRMTIAARHLEVRYILSCFIIRTIYFLLKEGSLKQVKSVSINSFREFNRNRSSFNHVFYKKIKSLKGFLWY